MGASLQYLLSFAVCPGVGEGMQALSLGVSKWFDLWNEHGDCLLVHSVASGESITLWCVSGHGGTRFFVVDVFDGPGKQCDGRVRHFASRRPRLCASRKGESRCISISHIFDRKPVSFVAISRRGKCAVRCL